MPSATPAPRVPSKKTARRPIPPAPAPAPLVRPDANTDARKARTVEYLREEHAREAALTKQGYCF
jgi:hypothetical protein